MNRLPTNTLSEEQIVAFIKNHSATASRMHKLHNYYIGKHDILTRTLADSTKENKPIPNPFGTKITNLMTGYFMGAPVTYTSENIDLMEQIQAIFDTNDEQAINAELALKASIYGTAYELLYSNEEGLIKQAVLNPDEVIILCDGSIQAKPLYAIRYYSIINIVDDAATTYVDVYSREAIAHYLLDGNTLSFMSEEPHRFYDVPVIEYENSIDSIGDFEPVINKIDEYDLLCTDTLNDFMSFVDTYLVLKGMDGTDTASLQGMKENRTMLVPDNASVEWLTKQVPDAHIENMLNRIRKDIYDLVDCPNMTDEAFGNTDTGVALKHKLQGLENRVSIKERYFKQALKYRLKLICNFINLDGVVNNFDYKEIKLTFTRNLPRDLVAEANLLRTLDGLVSKRTAFSMVSFITNPEEEIAAIEEEQGAFLIEEPADADSQQ